MIHELSNPGMVNTILEMAHNFGLTEGQGEGQKNMSYLLLAWPTSLHKDTSGTHSYFLEKRGKPGLRRVLHGFFREQAVLYTALSQTDFGLAPSFGEKGYSEQEQTVIDSCVAFYPGCDILLTFGWYLLSNRSVCFKFSLYTVLKNLH